MLAAIPARAPSLPGALDQGAQLSRVWRIRGEAELGALAGGFILGGTVGIGTVAFALLIGPGVHAVFYVAEPRFAGLR